MPRLVDFVAVDLGPLSLPLAYVDAHGNEGTITATELATRPTPLTLVGPLRLGQTTHEGDVTLASAGADAAHTSTSR